MDVGHFCLMTCVGALVLGNACALIAQTGFDPQVCARKSNPSVCILTSLNLQNHQQSPDGSCPKVATPPSVPGAVVIPCHYEWG